MKELSIEEKAKRYDETIEQLRTMIPNWESLSYNGKTFLQDLVYIIPELKESEGEQHRKWILEYLYDGLRKSDEQFKDHFKSAIAWLEKQGEQKLVKVPKFKVGDFIQFNGMWHTRFKIKEVCGLSHYINSCNRRMDMAYTDANFELVEQKPAWSDEDERIYQSIMDDTVQENQLDGKQIDWLRDIKYRHFSQSQQEWSEEDETRLTNTIIMLKEGASLHFNKKDIAKAVDWLKSIRPQKL